MYYKELHNGLVLQNTQATHAAQLHDLQRLIFPTLAEEERMSARHYLHHLTLFPEGQFVLLDGDAVVGMSSCIRYHLAEEDHTFLEISDNLWFNTHQPEGQWLYGMDMGVHPDYRGRGLAREMYRARQELCAQLKLAGQIIVGMPNGYVRYAGKMSLEAYFEALKAGTLTDPTVSVQQKMGGKIQRLIPNYLDDPQCGNGGVMMILRADELV
jgi:GNAT superfamily N-acetyltransferase